ncbi:hypothetical protein VOLCADRAFT_92065 [Volvox carteri f. nagariensis]|uniref:Arf-GAP domain-containing protein n=1 Tax=Volvox carteri f. nagariensis TaxID=3068 RepID=D8TZ09_VOLCA|nr:uncharacterized protein VOLCADRAFT_92065 [Volvox carteri f. nagariensis]EFJ47402.1 hypothetical protein VOLCADRAFT_92065 [Volvox carteri f. nagariensis]|eukprot:XP_002951591.1 hypothetical protein VOLCADRAFT_92065 [Volvox carteri f. nagariensis]
MVMEAASWLRDYVTAIKNGRGPSGTMLAELAKLSKDQEHCEVIFAVLEYRIRSPEHKWLCVYKVLDYLLQRGSQHCCNAAQELVVPLGALQNFAFVGPDGKDHGMNVRKRAEAVKAMILDSETLEKKRAEFAARAGNMKFAGYSREEAMAAAAAAKGGGGGYSGAPFAGTTSTDSSPGGPLTPAPALALWDAAGDGSSREGTAVGCPATTPMASLGPPGSPPGECPASPSTYRPPSMLLVRQASSATRLGQQLSSSLRNAGETKGVTFEQNKRQLEQLRQLVLLKDNTTCADCASAAAAARPTWASINLGVFICMRCAGIHRGLGVHISKVRSTTLDTWLPEQVDMMARLGNRRANAYFEARLDSATRPNRDSTHDLERFIRLKYADKAWAANGPWPPEDGVAIVTASGPQAPQSGSASAKQPSGAAGGAPLLCSPPPPLPGNSIPPFNLDSASASASRGVSLSPVVDVASSGGGFGDAPPAWPSPAPSVTPPTSAGTSNLGMLRRQGMLQEGQWMGQQPQQSFVPSRLGQTAEAPWAVAPAAAAAAAAGKSAAGGTAVRLLPPPPPQPLPPPPASGLAVGAGFGAAGAASAVAPSGQEGIGLLSSTTDLLQLDSDEIEQDGEDMESGGEGTDLRGGAGGGPGAGSSLALWDLLDLNVGVMDFLERTEGGCHPHPHKHPQAEERQQQQEPHRLLVSSAPPVVGGPGAGAGPQAVPAAQLTSDSAVPTTGLAYLSTAAGCLPGFGTPASTDEATAVAAPSSSQGMGMGTSGRATYVTGPTRLGVADSVIMTSEFPVYDLLTPLPTGGGAPPPMAIGPTAAVATAAGPTLATSRFAAINVAAPTASAPTASARPVDAPPRAFSPPFPPPQQHQVQYPATQQPSSAIQQLSNGGVTAVATISTTTAVFTPNTSGGGFQPNSSFGRSVGMARMGHGNGMGMVMGMRGAAPHPASAATAAHGPAMDLDNLLAMQLDNLDASLAKGPNASSGGGSGAGGGKPSWQASGSVGGVFGSMGGGYG